MKLAYSLFRRLETLYCFFYYYLTLAGQNGNKYHEPRFTLVMLNPVDLFKNNVEPDQLASDEAS